MLTERQMRDRRMEWSYLIIAFFDDLVDDLMTRVSWPFPAFSGEVIKVPVGTQTMSRTLGSKVTETVSSAAPTSTHSIAEHSPRSASPRRSAWFSPRTELRDGQVRWLWSLAKQRRSATGRPFVRRGVMLRT
jgi:hypothetical protein